MNNKTIMYIVGAAVILYGAFFIYRYIGCNDRGYPRSVCICKGTGSSFEHCANRSVRNMF